MSVEKVIIRTSYKTTNEQEVKFSDFYKAVGGDFKWIEFVLLQKEVLYMHRFSYRMVEKVIA